MSARLRRVRVIQIGLALFAGIAMTASTAFAAFQHTTYKPMLMGKEWVAVTGEPLSATAGARMFMKGGNAVDAAAAMLAAVCVLNDSLSFGGENQALIYDPNRHKVFAINGLGIAPTRATPEYFTRRGMKFPPAFGPLAAVTPGIPGSLIQMLAEFGSMSLKEVLQPAIELAEGYPMEAQTASEYNTYRSDFEKWDYSQEVFLPGGMPPKPNQIFIQRDLAETFRKMVAAEQEALGAGKGRKEGLYAAYDRFYKGDIAAEFVRGSREGGGLITLEDMARWKPIIEEPVKTTYRGIDVYKLTVWTQGPVMLQVLNILEGFDLKAMGHNSPEYIHTIYQAMNLAFADRDFYYGDPYFAPEEPVKGLLAKEYAAERRKFIDPQKNNPQVGPGDPYPFQGGMNPYLDLLQEMSARRAEVPTAIGDHGLAAGTSSIQTADSKGWVVSVTPSGGWPPAYLAGHTGIGMSQRMQSFVLDPKMNPFNVLAPGKRPRVTLTPSLALKDSHPYLSFSVPGGDLQDQFLLQFFLNVVEFGMDVQQAAEAPKFESFQMYSSFGGHPITPGRLVLDTRIPRPIADALRAKEYKVEFSQEGVRGEHGGAITAIGIDWENQILMGGQGIPDQGWAGPRYGIAW
jgi:gamma-glutamyltranspeptidase/glutathione hydrolase